VADGRDLRGDVRRELTAVRTRGFWRLNDTNLVMVQTLSLEQAACHVRDYRENLTRVAVIELLLRYEVPQLPRPYSDWLMVLFGLRDGDQGRATASLREEAAKLAGERYAEVFRRTKENAALDALADQIVADCLGSATQEIVIQRKSDYDQASPLYIPRPEIEDLFRNFHRDDRRVIVFHGHPGVGKSWLAHELTRGETGEAAPRIRVRNGQMVQADLWTALLEAKVDVSYISGCDPVEQLAVLLCSEQAPDFVILDNLDTAKQLDDLLPLRPKATVVATCLAIDYSRPNWALVPVRVMTRDEATRMVHTRLTSATAQDARILSFLVGQQPLAIHYACLLVAKGGVTIAELCNELWRNTRAFVEGARTEEGEPFAAVIRRLVQLIGERDNLAYRVLELLPFCQFRQLYFLGAIRTYLWVNYGLSGSVVRYAQAIELLRDFSIVELCPDCSEELRVPNLANSVLYSISQCRAVGVAVGLLKTLEYYAQQYTGSRTIDLSLIVKTSPEYSEVVVTFMHTVLLWGQLLIEGQLCCLAIVDASTRDEVERWLASTLMKHRRTIKKFDSLERGAFTSQVPERWFDWARLHDKPSISTTSQDSPPSDMTTA
jgi:hypothetical protein